MWKGVIYPPTDLGRHSWNVFTGEILRISALEDESYLWLFSRRLLPVHWYYSIQCAPLDLYGYIATKNKCNFSRFICEEWNRELIVIDCFEWLEVAQQPLTKEWTRGSGPMVFNFEITKNKTENCDASGQKIKQMLTRTENSWLVLVFQYTGNWARDFCGRKWNTSSVSLFLIAYETTGIVRSSVL